MVAHVRKATWAVVSFHGVCLLWPAPFVPEAIRVRPMGLRDQQL